MDRITTSLLSEFSKEHGIEKLSEDKQFEHFTSLITVAPFLSEMFYTDDIVVGSGSDTGIDGIAIIVNGVLISDSDGIDDYVKDLPHLDVSFIFIQAERSSSFDASKIGTFAFGVQDFFSEKPSLPRNDKISSAAKIMAAIYARSSKFNRGNPICKLYYVTTGKWVDDANLVARKNTAVTDLTSLNLFREVDFIPVDANSIQRLYLESKNSVSCEFDFVQKTVVPSIEGVDEAYLGILPATEFLKLIQDDKGEILKGIFYDNVRDWQDYNNVNSEMKATLTSDSQRAQFALMNNGVTVIAKTLRPTGNKFYIEDYQIVNGCQTSHVLSDQAALLDKTVMVPLRLISTKNEEITASIIKATNRQTEVSEENLLALLDFQKKLETYFISFEDTQKLYYERRSRQYNNSVIEKTRIIPPGILIRSFASIFLKEPHRTSRNYKALSETVRKDWFKKDDRLEPYYMAAYAFYKLDYLFRNQILDSKYKSARYQLLLAFRLLLNKGDAPKINSADMNRFCQHFIDILWDMEKSEFAFKQAITAIEKVSQGDLHSDNIRTASFTQELISYCLKTTVNFPATDKKRKIV